jgi:hypothetical protein
LAHDASSILGTPQLAGVKVNPRGLGKAAGAGSRGIPVGGIVGAGVSAAASMKADKTKKEAAAASDAPDFGPLAYLSVTDTELALVSLKQKGLGLKLEDVIARVPRSDVTAIELGGGRTLFSPPLTITFASGDNWLLEVPRPSKKQAQEVIQVLGL